MKFVDELQNYLKARYPLILIKSTEEDRLTMDLKLVAKTLGHDLITWSIASGLKSDNKQFDIGTVEPKKAIDTCESIAKTDKPTIFVNDEETSVVDDNGEKPLVSKEYFVSKYLKVYNSDFLNHKFDLTVEINLFKTYPMKINFGQSLFYSDEWLGCHIDINLRNDFPNIDLYLCGCKRELCSFKTPIFLL